mmetsp:Transcript_10994/g.12570  ORF Transcript_10994/g.12570 Transcript_10994/m.12570 type:complete len:195 (+) Transcript_10994:120-704(+)
MRLTNIIKGKMVAKVGDTKTPSKKISPLQALVEAFNKNKTRFIPYLFPVIVIIVAKFFKANEPETKALEIGSTFVAGDVLSKCGAWDLVRPPRFQTCKDPMTLVMGDDGVLTLYNGGPWRLWEGEDGHLPLIEMNSKERTGSAEIGENGILTIGGEVAKITYFSESAPIRLAPWPFAMELPGKNGKKKKTGKEL